MKQIHTVIIVTGIGEMSRGLELITRHWRKADLNPVVHSIGWGDLEIGFDIKLKKLLVVIDSFVKRGDQISLVGVSAGGSAALNAFAERRKIIHRVVSVCGRLRVGSRSGFRSFQKTTAVSPAFAASVILAEENTRTFVDSDKAKILTMRAKYGDELVPPDTAVIEGVTNILIPTPLHTFSIVIGLTFFSKPLLKFLNQ